MLENVKKSLESLESGVDELTKAIKRYDDEDEEDSKEIKASEKEESEEKEEKEEEGTKKTKSKECGKLIAQLALSKGLKKVVFDRGGYKYHGRISEFALGAREGGLEF